MSPTENLNQRAAAICREIEASAQTLDVQIIRTPAGAMILDFGTDRTSTHEAGILLSRICMADLASIEQIESPIDDFDFPFLKVETEAPLNACIGAQYAGWPFSTENIFSMCSGPARMKRGKEEILTRYGLIDQTDGAAVAIFESNRIPNDEDIAEFASECNCSTQDVVICIAKTCSLPGTMQVVSRIVETAMHKLFEIGFDLTKVKKASGTAPVCPLGKDDYQAMGWTNDCILYGGEVQLWVDEPADLDELVKQLPSSSSDEHGRPFIEIFEFYERDFYKVDRMLFSPAKVTVHCLSSNQSATAGELRTDLLIDSFKS